jgi:hypothetical protein
MHGLIMEMHTVCVRLYEKLLNRIELFESICDTFRDKSGNRLCEGSCSDSCNTVFYLFIKEGLDDDYVFPIIFIYPSDISELRISEEKFI